MMMPGQSRSGTVEFTAQSHSLYKPFVTSRQFSPDGLTLPGIKIPDKPQNLPKPGEKCGEGVVRGAQRRAKPISIANYEPSQLIRMGEQVLSVHPVCHELGREIIGVRFSSRLEIHALRLRTVENDEFFTMEKLQECVAREDDLIQTMSVGFNSNIGFGTKRLTYAFSLFNRSDVYYVKDEPLTALPFQSRINYDDTNLVTCFDEHRSPVRAIAFDGENGALMASLAKEPICKIWDLKKRKLYGTLILESTGVAVVFHKSESYKVLIVERDGWLKFYSLATRSVVYSICASTMPILSTDWCHLDPLIVAVGHFNFIHLFNIADLNSEPSLAVDSYGANKMVKFSTADPFIFATVGKPKNDLRVFHTRMRTPLWSQRKEQIQYIEWVYGKPFLMACVGDTIQFYEASLY